MWFYFKILCGNLFWTLLACVHGTKWQRPWEKRRKYDLSNAGGTSAGKKPESSLSTHPESMAFYPLLCQACQSSCPLWLKHICVRVAYIITEWNINLTGNKEKLNAPPVCACKYLLSCFHCWVSVGLPFVLDKTHNSTFPYLDNRRVLVFTSGLGWNAKAGSGFTHLCCSW